MKIKTVELKTLRKIIIEKYENLKKQLEKNTKTIKRKPNNMHSSLLVDFLAENPRAC